MPTNPFGKDDPLGGNAGTNGGAAWGAAGQGAAGFGQPAAVDQSYGGEEYDVVEISEDGPAAAPPAKPGKAPSFQKGTGGASLSAREQALAQREAEVRRREVALNRGGGAGVDPMLIKNFPPCCPIVHHDIANDIPEFNKNITRAGFMVFLFTTITLIYNFVCALMAVFVADVTGDTTAAWFFAALYAVLGIPGAWFLWYKRLYRAMMTDGAMSFAAFFIVFIFHIGFCVWSAVAPDFGNADMSHAGWLTAIDIFKGGGGENNFVGIMFFVGAACWTALAFLSFTYMVRVYNNMRGRDLARDVRQEAYVAGAHAAAEDIRRNGAGSRV